MPRLATGRSAVVPAPDSEPEGQPGCKRHRAGAEDQRGDSLARRRNALTPSRPESSATSSDHRATATPERSKRERSAARCSTHSLNARRVEPRPRRHELLGRHLDHDEVVPARCEVEEGGDRALVEQRGHGEHERLRRQRACRDHVDVLPGVAELDARLEQGVDEAVALHEAEARLQPAEDAAEGDEPDPVAAREVATGERRRGSHGALERPVRALLAAPGLGKAVEEEDDVRIPVRVPLVHDQLAAPGARPPVHRPQPVAGDECPRVGELEPVGAYPRDEVARHELGLERRDEALEELGPRVDADLVRAAGRGPPTTSIAIRPRARSRMSPSSYEPHRSQRRVSGSVRSSSAWSRSP